MSGKDWREHRDQLGPVAIIAAGFVVVAVVWVLTGWWSYSEQRDSAAGFGFDHPALLFWATDGFAIACALLALAATIDNRSAPFARLGVIAALSASAWFNAGGTQDRLGDGAPVRAVVMAAAVPIVSWLALEAILLAIRPAVRRWRGLPAPVGVPSVRFGRLLLGGWPVFCEWRRMYLDRTQPGAVAVTTVDDLRAELATVRDQIPAPIDAVTQAELQEAVTAILGSIPAPVQVPVPEVTQADLTRVRDDLELAARFDREAVLREVRTAAAETARAVAEEHRSTGTPRAPRTGRRTGTGTGTKRERYELAYRSLVEGGTPEGEITGKDLDRTAGFPEDDTGYGRRILRDLRAIGGLDAQVLHLNGSHA